MVRRTINATGVGAIIVDGEPQKIPAPGEALVIPGRVSVRAAVRTDIGKRGVRVHALRVELLDTALVVDIGTAPATILR